MATTPGERRGREWQVFQRYETINDMAEALHDSEEGVFDREVMRDFRSIGHIYNGIPYHLDPLMGKMRGTQVYGITCQECLNDDIKKYLGVENEFYGKHNPRHRDELFLSGKARANLRWFLARDYEIIDSLNTMGLLTPRKYQYLSKR